MALADFTVEELTDIHLLCGKGNKTNAKHNDSAVSDFRFVVFFTIRPLQMLREDFGELDCLLSQREVVKNI